jgi:hypothetical protein
MQRSVLAPLLALAASACTYGSAVDIAPFEARTDGAVLLPGDYCEMKMGSSPKVISSEDCLRIEWDDARRIHTMIDLSKVGPDDPERPEGSDRQEIAVVALGGDVYAAQFDNPDEVGRHELITFLARGEAFVGVSAVQAATLRRLVAAHPAMVWENLPPERQAGESEPLIPSSPFIRSAAVDEIKAFLRDATVASLREDKLEPDDIPSVGVRDSAGAPDHAPSEAQLKAGRDLLRLRDQLRK